MFHHLGVRGRLFLAFFGISAFAVLAAAAAIYSFSEFGKVLGRITQERVPSALASLELSRQAERIVAAAPVLLTVTTPEQHKEQSERIADEVAQLDGLLSDVRKSTVDTIALDPIESAVSGLRTNLAALDELVANRLAVGRKKDQLLEVLQATHTATQRLLAPWVLVAESTISQIERSSGGTDLPVEERRGTLAALIEAKDSRERVQQALLDASVINDTLRQMANAETTEQLPILSFRLRKRITKLEELAGRFAPKLKELLLVQTQEFRDLNQAKGSLADVRGRELELAAAGKRLILENSALARQLTGAVDRLVEAANKDIGLANIEAQSAERLGTGVLAAVVVMSLISSALIVWLYVGRNVIARLTALSDSMLAIAGGDLRASLPETGGDEIGRMAVALSVFRDTAVEVEERNLRQIAEARQRLVDAIESISEGFSFFDSDDRLVLSNRRFRELLNPGSENAEALGTNFATIIRNAAESGLVCDAEGRIDDWLAERMERHRNPSGSFLQRRSDGRWIEITEYKTADQGTVAIYTDITAQKQQELALLEEKQRTEEASALVHQKNQMLESLSAKLSKYLSPQVYSSIFSGQQSVEIATKRKKLTVFFADIAGFTEITDSLESEDLTALLNSYLTEMSAIALEYGATIDKFIGDAMMMFFGDPESKGIKNDAIACVQMAIAMQRRARELRSEWLERGIEQPFQLRIGINTGYCSVGNFGSEDRMDYTIIGGEVNLAARLQSRAPLGGILISYETRSLVSDAVQTVEQAPITVKGFPRPVRNFQAAVVLGEQGDDAGIIEVEQAGMKLRLDLDGLGDMGKAEAIEAIEKILGRLKG